MTFAIVTNTYKPKKKIYLKIISGIPTKIQILDEHSTSVYKHWITDGAGRRVGITCPGKDVCPICLRNREIGFNREHPDFVSLQHRHRINVLDLTDVKRCPNCDAIYAASAAPEVCTGDGCGTNLQGVEVTPLREVKILERGRTLMEQFNALEQTPHTATGKVETLQSYPIMLVATGSGTSMIIVAVPQAPTGEDVSKYEKHDLTQGLNLSPEEITYLINGGVLRDVLAARNAEAQTPTPVQQINPIIQSEDIPF